MINFLTILIVLICILLILVILIQNSKGGGLTSGLAGNAQLMGVRKTTDFLEKATWTLAIALVVLSLLVNMLGKSAGTGPAQDTELREKINTTETKPLNMPSNTAPAPGQTTPPPAGAGQ
jgi:preprotein translocase subunit SecG